MKYREEGWLTGLKHEIGQWPLLKQCQHGLDPWEKMKKNVQLTWVKCYQYYSTNEINYGSNYLNDTNKCILKD